MTKITIRKEKRYFVSDDSEFSVQHPEEKALPVKHLRSYSVKHALFHGDFKVTEGNFVFKFKAAMVYVAKDILYAYEYEKYFMKDLEVDTITYINADQVPAEIRALLEGDAPELKAAEVKLAIPELKEPIVEASSEGAEPSAELPEIVEEEELPKAPPKKERKTKKKRSKK